MGLLDDAIREHLELKRRHGGDPGEIERQEHEAFGSAGREDADPDAPGAIAAGDAPVTEEHPEPAEPAPEDFAADAPTTAHAPAQREEATDDEIDPPEGEEEVPGPGHEADAPGYDEDPWLEEDDGPRGAAGPPREGEEDVLEETPDFLQETPEHDRLWFEQKPPRGFDWDR